MAIAAAAGAVAIGVVAFLVIMGAGDEPPIRVKNGSIDFLLGGGEWREDNPCTKGDQAPCWEPSAGENSGAFDVVVMSDTTCVIPTGWTIDKITVVPSVGRKVTLKPGKGGHIRQATKVRPHAALTRDANHRERLYHDAAEAYVKELEFDGENAQGDADKFRCTFSGKEDLKVACIWSWATANHACTP
jgi:hypothetical protein